MTAQPLFISDGLVNEPVANFEREQDAFKSGKNLKDWCRQKILIPETGLWPIYGYFIPMTDSRRTLFSIRC